jgi:HEAT repeat protein
MRRAAKALKKKDPEQLLSGLCQQLVRCAPKTPGREKYSHAKRKTDQLHNSTPRNYLATLNSNELHSSSAKL